MSESGERRQPRLTDVTRLEATVAALDTKLSEAIGTMGAQSVTMAANPFNGMTIADLQRLMILVNVASIDPGKAISPKVIYDRVQACEQVGKWLSGEEEPEWVAESRARADKVRKDDARRNLAEAQRKSRTDGAVHTATPIPTADVEAEALRMAEAEAASA